MPDFMHEATEVARRFHRETEWFSERIDGALYTTIAHANSERVVEVFQRLAMFLDSPVDIVVSDRRQQREWQGALRALSDVREALGRLRWPLATFGGVEITLVTADDQLTLRSSLALVAYARCDRWRARLEAEGFVAREAIPAPVWRRNDVVFAPAPELDAAIAVVVERLALASES